MKGRRVAGRLLRCDLGGHRLDGLGLVGGGQPGGKLLRAVLLLLRELDAEGLAAARAEIDRRLAAGAAAGGGGGGERRGTRGLGAFGGRGGLWVCGAAPPPSPFPSLACHVLFEGAFAARGELV